MKLSDIIGQLEPLLPILGGLTGHPEIGTLAARLIDLAEEEIARRQAQQGRTRSEILADAETTFVEAKIENEKLKRLGHENE